MNKTTTFSFLFFAFLTLAGFSSSSLFAQASTLSGTSSTTVYFGTPEDDGGICVGRGVCGDNVAGGTNVTFVVMPNDPNTLMMIFSLSQLQQVQPGQVAYFTNNSGSYMFDAPYNLSADPALASLNLPANSQILPSSPSLIQINGDIVIDFIQYSTGN